MTASEMVLLAEIIIDVQASGKPTKDVGNCNFIICDLLHDIMSGLFRKLIESKTNGQDKESNS